METEQELNGRVCIVTGANSGIGKEVTRGLAKRGATVVMACRNAERGHAAREELATDTGSDALTLMQVDLSRQSEVHRFADEVLARFPKIHVLVNNAGIYPDTRRFTEDDVEETWATNVLAYLLLTERLLERLKESAPARIVNVASTRAGRLDEEDLFFSRRSFNGVHAYEQSKQANRMLSWVRAAELEGTGVTVNVAHPGPVATGIARHQKGVFGAIVRAGFRIFGKSPSEGADTPLWLAAAPELEGVSGKFYGKRKEIFCEFWHEERQSRLRARCEEMLKRRPPEADAPS